MALFLGDITVEGLDGERPLQTGEVVIIVVVLLMWAGKYWMGKQGRGAEVVGSCVLRKGRKKQWGGAEGGNQDKFEGREATASPEMRAAWAPGNEGFSSCVDISVPCKASRTLMVLLFSAVIGLFCRQYDIIKDNDSNNNPKEKGKGPEQSPQGRPVGTRQVMWDQ